MNDSPRPGGLKEPLELVAEGGRLDPTGDHVARSREGSDPLGMIDGDQSPPSIGAMFATRVPDLEPIDAESAEGDLDHVTHVAVVEFREIESQIAIGTRRHRPRDR